MDDFPRRNQLDKCVPAELAVDSVLQAVEALPADPRHTDLGQLVQQARTVVSDLVDAHFRLTEENASLKADNAVNARMLARQCDLTREAENEASTLRAHVTQQAQALEETDLEKLAVRCIESTLQLRNTKSTDPRWYAKAIGSVKFQLRAALASTPPQAPTP